jgi:hypothetical protein
MGEQAEDKLTQDNENPGDSWSDAMGRGGIWNEE